MILGWKTTLLTSSHSVKVGTRVGLHSGAGDEEPFVNAAVDWRWWLVLAPRNVLEL